MAVVASFGALLVTARVVAGQSGGGVLSYGHLGQVRHRSEPVEYRVEQHAAKLGARLEALRGAGFGTTIGTTT